MKKTDTIKPAQVEDLVPGYTEAHFSFYRPHKRVQYTGELVDPWTGVVSFPERRVKQSFKAECDINNIISQYKAGNQVTHIRKNAAEGAYVDLPDSVDFQEALELVMQSEKSFATLPSHVRERFGNDPAEFLAFMSDPANQDEAIKLGLAVDKRPPPSTEPPPSSSTGDLKLDD